MTGHDLPDGMVTIGGALAGFLTELEERCERGKHGTDPNNQTGLLD